MSVALVGPNTPMLLGQGRRGLWAPLRTSLTPAAYSVLDLSSIPGLSGWWDAGGLSGMLDSTGRSVAGWGQAVSGLLDKSGLGRSLQPFSFGPLAGLPTATPRLDGLLGGVGRVTATPGALWPALDPDQGFQVAAVPMGTQNSWTRHLVWSRPNWRQYSGHDTSPISLLTSAGIPVLQADSVGPRSRLILFPGPAQLVLTTSLERRHTHSVTLRNVAGGGTDAWLDGVHVGTVTSNPLISNAITPLVLLHDTTVAGAAQCWLHELAFWERALSDTEMLAVNAYTSRWALGVRHGIVLVINGQSNAINYALNDGAAQTLAQGVAWHLGALAGNVVASMGSSTSYTLAPGHGLYAAVGGAYPASFVNNPNDGSAPSGWSLGTDGQAVATALATLALADRADIAAVVWPWSETDTLRNYSEKSVFKAAATRFLALERAMLGRTAADLPVIWWNAIPYGGNSGMQMHREVVAELAADPTQNVVIGNPQTADSLPRGAAWNPTAGTWTGGDTAHRDATDNLRFARLAAPLVARAVSATGRSDTLTIPSGIARRGGPTILHAWHQTPTTVVLTIQHDTGTELIVPLQATSGVGFSIMDGGSVASPASIIQAIGCARIDATHLRLTLASAPANPSAFCSLFYPYGNVTIGRGNAVTDNAATLVNPIGWNIATDLGSAWSLNYPLTATTIPIPLNDAH